MAAPQIVALGGIGEDDVAGRLIRFALELTGKERRRPVYEELVANGFPPGLAADDTAALHLVGTELREVVAAREGACGYRVEPTAETPIDARLLEKE